MNDKPIICKDSSPPVYFTQSEQNNKVMDENSPQPADAGLTDLLPEKTELLAPEKPPEIVTNELTSVSPPTAVAAEINGNSTEVEPELDQLKDMQMENTAPQVQKPREQTPAAPNLKEPTPEPEPEPVVIRKKKMNPLLELGRGNRTKDDAPEKPKIVPKTKKSGMAGNEPKGPPARPTLIKQLPPTMSIQPRKPVQLLVQFAGCPRPKIIWIKDGRNIPIEDERYEINNEGFISTLVIAEPLAQDAGIFECHVRNDQGEMRTKCKLGVSFAVKTPITTIEPGQLIEGQDKSPAKLTSVLEPQASSKGERSVILKYSGNPEPVIQWVCDDLEIKKNTLKFLTIQRNGVATLMLEERTAPKQTIGCTVHNDLGNAGTTALVDWIASGKPAVLKCSQQSSVADAPPKGLPRFADLPESQRTKMSHKCKVDVHVYGEPQPTLTWMHKGKPIESDKKRKIVTHESKSCMEIGYMRDILAGEYVIRATNQWGSTEASITLQCVPE